MTRLRSWREARRRTQLVFVLLAAIPVVLAAIYVARGAPDLAPGASPTQMHLADTSALAFTGYVVWLCAPLVVTSVAALFGGDVLASEQQWGTLRYRLARGASRERTLVRAAWAATTLTLAALATLVVSSVLVGWIAFGWHPLNTPVGGELSTTAGLIRIAGAVAYVAVTLLPIVAIALCAACWFDGPLTAVAAAIGVVVVSQVLDSLPSLGAARAALPTHYAYAWTNLFVDPPQLHDVAAGLLQASIIATLCFVIAAVRFTQRDIVS